MGCNIKGFRLLAYGKIHMFASASCSTIAAVWDSVAFTIMNCNRYVQEDFMLTYLGGKVGETLGEEQKYFPYLKRGSIFVYCPTLGVEFSIYKKRLPHAS